MPDGGLLLIFEDRTEQVQLSSARDTLLRVRTATFDNLFEAIGVFASDGRLHLWNSRFRQIWGVEESLLGSHPRIVERKQRGGRVAFADGRVFDFAAIPLPDGNALFTMLDVTDSRRMEQVLRDRNESLIETDKLKTAFLSNMSYELRTPLTSISGFAEMMQAGFAGVLPTAAAEYVDAIMQSTGRLAVLIDNVLDLTQGEAGALPLESRSVDLAAVARESAKRVADAAKEKGLDFVIDIKPSLGRIQGDARRLGQALDRVLDNAVRYCPAGSRVLVYGDGQLRTARLIVSDNGPGMDATAQSRVFDRFSRADQAKRGETLGLGLPLARQLVSEPGQGTLITIDLPRESAPSA